MILSMKFSENRKGSQEWKIQTHGKHREQTNKKHRQLQRWATQIPTKNGDEPLLS